MDDRPAPRPLLVLPENVPCLALRPPYAGLLFPRVIDPADPGRVGRKEFETRLWPWPYDPGWLAIYATRGVDAEAFGRLGLDLADPAFSVRGAVIGVVYVGGCRPMVAEDAEGACYPHTPGEGRYAWPLLASHRYPEPDRETLARGGPRKFVFLRREDVVRHLWPGGPDHECGLSPDAAAALQAGRRPPEGAS